MGHFENAVVVDEGQMCGLVHDCKTATYRWMNNEDRYFGPRFNTRDEAKAWLRTEDGQRQSNEKQEAKA